MKKLIISLVTLSTLIISSVLADTLELADGTLLEGNFVGSSNGIIMFNTGASIEAFPENEVVGIFLSSGVTTAQAPCEITIGSDRPSNSLNVVLSNISQLIAAGSRHPAHPG
jgi:hypothetical protein